MIVKPWHKVFLMGMLIACATLIALAIVGSTFAAQPVVCEVAR